MKNILFFLFAVTSFSVSGSEDFSSIDELVEKQLGCPIAYLPWRETYDSKRTQYDLVKECAFCAEIASGNDERYFILHRFKHHVVMFNIFPATKGHLLVVPYAHAPTLSDFSREAQEELIYIISLSLDVLKKVLNVQEANFGANLGRVAGASIPDHMHVHIIPRCLYERSFIHIIGGLATIGYDMQKLYKQIKEGFDTLLLKQ